MAALPVWRNKPTVPVYIKRRLAQTYLLATGCSVVRCLYLLHLLRCSPKDTATHPKESRDAKRIRRYNRPPWKPNWELCFTRQMRNNFRIKLSTARTAVFQVYGVGGG